MANKKTQSIKVELRTFRRLQRIEAAAKHVLDLEARGRLPSTDELSELRRSVESTLVDDSETASA